MTLLRGLLLPLLLAAALGSLLHFGVGPRVGAYPARIMMDVGVAIILAVSLTIVNGYTGQFSMGHAGFMALGAYAAGTITYYGSLLAWGDCAKQGGFLGVGEWMLVAACLAAGLVAAGAGWLVGLPSLRLRGDYLAIVTLGFGEILRVLLQQTNPQIFAADSLHEATWRQLLPPPVGGAQGFADIPKYANLFWIYVFVAVTVAFAYRLKQSSTGRAMLAIREDEVAAQAMGVNVTRLKVRAFVAAAFFAGVAGGLYAHQSGAILRPVDAGFLRSFDIIIMVVLGGMGSISGAIVAAIILTVLPQALLNLAQYRMVLYALALVLLMIFRPQGLFGVKEIWDLWPRRARRTKP
ncbi:MAG: branched-chain amino acid ABC transporter permease [Phycisphaerales bacterium]|nr:branched-chain amino acid ABC transporter permease [Phycisphaerales bacterium]